MHAYHTNMATQNEGVSLQGNFHDFFEKWTVEQNQYLRELVSAAKTPTTTTTPPDSSVSGLVHQVIGHYEEYYKVKSHWVQMDVITMLAPPWMTDLENSFQWIGGWRPSMAFHLLYSKAGLQLEAVLKQACSDQQGSSSLASLGPVHLGLVDQLQKKTIAQERQITEEMARYQETVADMDMVKLSHEVTELMGKANGTGDYKDEVEMDDKQKQRFKTTLMPKEEGLKRIVRGADDLRLRTLKGVTEILSPNQALHFLIAAAELHLRLHDWGKQLVLDDKKHGDGIAQNHH